MSRPGKSIAGVLIEGLETWEVYVFFFIATKWITMNLVATHDFTFLKVIGCAWLDCSVPWAKGRVLQLDRERSHFKPIQMCFQKPLQFRYCTEVPIFLVAFIRTSLSLL